MTPSISRIALVGILVFALEAVGFGTTTPTGASQPGAPDLTIDLPEYVVTASHVLPEPEHWRYAKIGEYEILSQTDDTTTRALAERLATMKAIVVALAGSTSAPPVTTSIILCNTDKTFREFIPQTVIKGVNLTWVDRLYLSDDFGQRTIVLKSNGVNDEARYRDLLRNYARAQLRARVPARPDWYVTGMAEIIADSNYRVESGRLTIEYGKTVAYREGIDVENFLTNSGGLEIENSSGSGRSLQNAGHDLGVPRTSLYEIEKPSGEILEVVGGILNNRTNGDHDRNNLTSLEDDVNGMRFNTYFPKNRVGSPSIVDILGHRPSLNQDEFRMGSWAFVHFGLFGRDRRFSNCLGELVKATSESGNVDPTRLFERIFRKQPAAFDIILSNYIEVIVSSGGTISSVFELPIVSVQDASVSKVGRIKGDALLAAKYVNSAKAEYISAYRMSRQQGNPDPRLLASIGILSAAEGDVAHAKPTLEYSMEHGASNVALYIELARLRINEIGNAAYSVKQTIHCLEPLIIAHDLCLPTAEVYEMVLDICLRTSGKPGDDIIQLLREGTKYFPADLKLKRGIDRLLDGKN